MGHHGGGSCVGCPTKRPPRKVNPITLLSGHRCCLATHARTPPQRAPAPAAEQRDRLGVADARRVGARDVPGEDAGGPAGRQGRTFTSASAAVADLALVRELVAADGDSNRVGYPASTGAHTACMQTRPWYCSRWWGAVTHPFDRLWCGDLVHPVHHRPTQPTVLTGMYTSLRSIRVSSFEDGLFRVRMRMCVWAADQHASSGVA